MQSEIPHYITHYYEHTRGPLRSVSVLDKEVARGIIKRITESNEGFSNNRPEAYIDWRTDVEDWLRNGFIAKGGKPKRKHPHYFVLGECDWLLSWYKNGRAYKMNLSDIDASQVTFTYPDSMVSFQLHQYYTLKNNPLFKEEEHRDYHGKVFLLHELQDTISKYGLPKGEAINGKPASLDMYIEVQVWDEIETDF